MTKNGIFLMIPKELIIQNIYRAIKNGFDDMSATIDWLIDFDGNHVQGLNYYAKRWGFGKKKTLRIRGEAKEAIENMQASHYFQKNQNFEQEKNDESGRTSKNIRTKN